MELLSLIAFVVIWVFYIKLQRFSRLQGGNNRKYMKGELPTFSDCAKYVEGKAIPGDFVPERDDGENQLYLTTYTIHIISNA